MSGRFRVSIGSDVWLAVVATLAVATLGAAIGLRLSVLGPARGGIQALERDLLILLALLFGVLAAGCVLLVWIGTRQQRAVARTALDARRARVAFRRVVEHLPIGFFEYRQSGYSSTNATFEEVLEATGSGSSRASLCALEEALSTALDGASEFEFALEVGEHEADARHLEVRGVPILGPNGDAEHLIGFCYDVTDLIDAKRQVQQKRDELERTNFQLRRALADLQDNFEAMVAAWVTAVEAKDPYTAGHSERVTRLAQKIGHRLGLGAHDLRVLEMGCLIHDVGKIGVPDEILLKTGPLTESEVAVIRTHPILGARMIELIPLFHDCVPIVRWHHEKLDGSGYPDGLSGAEIPLLVQVATVADMFDAMTSTRAYREAMSSKEALSELEKEVRAGAIGAKIVAILADIVHGETAAQPLSDKRAA